MRNTITTNATNVTEVNRRKLDLLTTNLQAMLAESLRRGFFGIVSVGLDIQDGTIQHVRHTMEQIER